MKTLIFICLAFWLLSTGFHPFGHWNGMELSLWLVDDSWVAMEFLAAIVVAIITVLGVALFALGIFAAVALAIGVTVLLCLIGGGLLSWPFLVLLVAVVWLARRGDNRTCNC